MKNFFLEGAFTGLLFVILFMAMTSPAFAQSESTPASSLHFADDLFATPSTTPTSTPPTTPTPLTTPPSTQPVLNPVSSDTNGQLASPGCTVSRLSPAEAAGVLSFTQDGFSGKSMGDGVDKNNPGRNLDGLKLIGQENGGDKAVSQTPPTQAAFADRFSWIPGVITGPMGVGLVLDDTLRVGRCDGLPQEQCRINGNGLTYRTSGVGFKSDLGNALSSLTTAAGRLKAGVSESEYAAMQNNIFQDDENHFTTGSITPTPADNAIKNVFQTASYTAKQATTCNNSACIISTYSAFDKYYNSWFSTNLVVSNIGPMFLHQAANMMGFLGARASKEGLIGKVNTIFESARQKLISAPYRLADIERYKKYNADIKKFGLGGTMKDLTIGKRLFSSGAMGKVDDILDPAGAVMKMSLEDKQNLFRVVDDLRAYARNSKAEVDSIKSMYKGAVDAAAANPTALLAAKRQYAVDLAKVFDNWDDTVYLDYPQWIKDNEVLNGFKGYLVKKNGSVADSGFVELTTSEQYNFKNIMKEFYKDGGDGSWRGWLNSTDMSTFEVDPLTGGLKLYEFKASKLVQGNVDVSELAKKAAQFGEGRLQIKLPTGEYLPLDSSAIKYIESNPALPGHVDLYEGGYAPKTTVPALTPDDFAARLTQDRVVSRINTANNNLDDLYYGMKNKGLSPRTSFGALDAQYAKESNLLKDYYMKPKTALVQGTLFPILYWNAKRGFGSEAFSAYMLPDTWTTLTISQGFESIYKDSYTDFFVNEGSDQGDLFQRTMGSMIFVWRYLIDNAAKLNPTANDILTRITGGTEGISTGSLTAKSIMRDSVKDVAFYSHNENCSGCSANLLYKNDYMNITGWKLPVMSQAFLVEAADAATVAAQGATLIAFTHHSDLQGKSGSIAGDKVNLVQARTDATTCDQKLRSMGLGWAGKGVGGLFGAGESLFYIIGIGPGIIASAVQQTVLAPKLQDCVDDVEGYYVHFYSPPAVQKAASASKEVLSNATVTDALSKMSTQVSGVAANKDGPVGDALKKVSDQFSQFSGDAQKNDLLQATVFLNPTSIGNLRGKELFYIWFLETAMPGNYKTDGKEVIKDGNKSLEINYATGQLKKDGKVIIDSNKADHIRLATEENKIPAEIIPLAINKVGQPNTTGSVFELNSYGEVKVTNLDVLNCIRKAVKDQTGIDYSGDELTQVFGTLTQMQTKSYGKVFVDQGKIYLEGTSPRVQGGVDSKFIIDGFWQSKLVMSKDGNQSVDAGKFLGMTFEHGVIVLKEETGELIIWIRQHKDSVLSNKDVAGLRGKLQTLTDPATGCEQSGITMQASAYPNDELGQLKVQNFNTSMDKMGPFTQFVTDSKIYDFYTKRDGNTGECKQYFKVIDKATGKVIEDSEIVGGVSQAADGTISFKTADGKSHSILLSEENGVPKLTYNNGNPETLRSAQGPNGSFWYDPTTGQWYPENGLQIPLDQSFKDNGTFLGSDKNGNVTGTPVNPMTFNLGSQQGNGFNIPSLPETATGLVGFIAAYLIVSFFITQRKTLKRKR